MRTAIAMMVMLCAFSFGQEPAPVPDSQVPQRKELMRNRRVVVSRVDLPPGSATPMHQHEHDTVNIIVTAGEMRTAQFGHKASAKKAKAGEVEYETAGYAHAVENTGSDPLTSVTVEFEDPQGKVKKIGTSSHSCESGDANCVDEKNLFCTAKVCVEDVIMSPGASTSKHSHATDHMLVAISDYELLDEVEGKGTITRTHRSGEVNYIPAGITHRLKNQGKMPAHFTVIVWR